MENPEKVQGCQFLNNLAVTSLFSDVLKISYILGLTKIFKDKSSSFRFGGATLRHGIWSTIVQIMAHRLVPSYYLNQC